MNRRNFLGSTLGMFVGFQIPWIGRELTEPTIELPQSKYKDFKSALILDNGLIVQGPNIHDIDYDIAKRINIITYNDINIYQTVTYTGLIFLYKNKIFSKQIFPKEKHICACSGDVLRLTHTMSEDNYSNLN